MTLGFQGVGVVTRVHGQLGGLGMSPAGRVVGRAAPRGLDVGPDVARGRGARRALGMPAPAAGTLVKIMISNHDYEYMEASVLILMITCLS